MALSIESSVIRLPAGTTAGRPTSPSTGMIRYNTDSKVIEYYNGTKWVVGIGGSPYTAATSGKAIVEQYPSAPSGIYWLKNPSGTTFQSYIEMSYGGGWIVMNGQALGPYSNPVTAAWGSGGSNMLSDGVYSPWGNFASLQASSQGQSQAGVYGCPGYNGVSRLRIDGTFKSHFNITECRFNASVTSHSGVVCGYVNPYLGNPTIISGSSGNFSGCSSSPTYSEQNPSSFTMEAYGLIANINDGGANPPIFETWTACGGSMSVRVNKIWVR